MDTLSDIGALKQPQLRLLHLTDIDEADELEQAWIIDFRELELIIADAGGSGNKIQAALQERASSDKGHARIINGLLFGNLCDRSRSADYFNLLNLVVRDGYAHCCKQLQRIANEKFTKMNDRGAAQASPQQIQLLELVRKLVSLDVQGVEKVLQALLRQIQGGNTRETNRWLARIQLQIMLENKGWLMEQRSLVPIVFYTFCRIAADHGDAKLEKMRRQEAALCCELWRERPAECRTLGRDAIRVLQDVSRIPEFEQLWADLINRPHIFGIPDLWTILSTKTPAHVLASRLTPEMEQQLLFIMSHVKMGQQQRYQKWYMSRWGLTTPEGESLIPDLIRYICCVYHPPNEVIRSEVVQRWAAVGWLLTTAKGEVHKANTKLSLFYDWLFFERRTKETSGDSIMMVEPAALLVMRSIPKWIDISSDLMEFLLAAADDWCPTYKQLCRRGVYNAASECVRLGVISGWDRVSAFPQLGGGLRTRVRAQFHGLCKDDPEKPSQEDVALFKADPDACPPAPRTPTSSPLSSPRSPGGWEDGWGHDAGNSVESSAETVQNFASGLLGGDVAMGADEDEDSEQLLSGGGEGVDELKGLSGGGGGEAAKLLAALDKDDNGTSGCTKEMRDLLMGWSVEGSCVTGGADGVVVKVLAEEVSSMWDSGACKSPRPGGLLRALIKASIGEGDAVKNAAATLCARLQGTGASLHGGDASLHGGGASLHGGGTSFGVGSDGTVPLMSAVLLTAICMMDFDAERRDQGALSLYRDVLGAEEARSGEVDGGVAKLVLRDLRSIFAEVGGSIMFTCLQAVLSGMPDETVGNSQVVQLLCCACAPADLSSLCASLQVGDFELLCRHAPLLKGDAAAVEALAHLVTDSLEWDSFEQHALWRLIMAEFGGLPAVVDAILPHIMTAVAHDACCPEATCGLACLLGGMPPSTTILSLLSTSTGACRREVAAPCVQRWAAVHSTTLSTSAVGVVQEGDAGTVEGLADLLSGGGARVGVVALSELPEVKAALDLWRGK